VASSNTINDLRCDLDGKSAPGANAVAAYRGPRRGAILEQIKTVRRNAANHGRLSYGTGEHMPHRKKPKPDKPAPPRKRPEPPPEDDLGGGDICSLEAEPSTDDDTPLD